MFGLWCHSGNSDDDVDNKDDDDKKTMAKMAIRKQTNTQKCTMNHINLSIYQIPWCLIVIHDTI